MADTARTVRCGALIRSARRRHGLDQSGLAKRVGTSQPAISRIERDLISPTVETLERILNAMGETLQVATLPLNEPAPGGSNQSIAELRADYRLSPEERLVQAAQLSEIATELAAGAELLMGRDGIDAEARASELRPLRPEPLLAVLVDHAVDFVIIGGYAVAAHGFARATKDIDICPAPDDDNLGRLAAALVELEATPIGLDEFEGEFDLKPNLEGLKMGGNWTLMTKQGRLDVMQNFSFDGAEEGEGDYRHLTSHAIERSFLGHQVKFCSYGDLLRMKQAAGRAQDMVDIESLKAARGEL